MGRLDTPLIVEEQILRHAKATNFDPAATVKVAGGVVPSVMWRVFDTPAG